MLQKLLTFFQQKYWHIRYEHLNFNETLTNKVLSFEQLGPAEQWFDHNSKFIVLLSESHKIDPKLSHIRPSYYFKESEFTDCEHLNCQQ